MNNATLKRLYATHGPETARKYLDKAANITKKERALAREESRLDQYFIALAVVGTALFLVGVALSSIRAEALPAVVVEKINRVPVPVLSSNLKLIKSKPVIRTVERKVYLKPKRRPVIRRPITAQPEIKPFVPFILAACPAGYYQASKGICFNSATKAVIFL